MKRFNNIVWSPVDYAKASVVARTAGEALLSRLKWMTIQPKLILDVGCGTGEMLSHLHTIYPDATVIAIDHSLDMIAYANAQATASCLCAEAENLPLPAQSADLILANFLIPWSPDFKKLLSE
jgi:malonyl-CoA O-methyltransferase